MTFAREGHAATLLTDGRVLVEGGDDSALISAELFDPTTGTWTLTGSTNSGRQWHSATLLNDGTVLVAGGNYNGFFSTPTAELFDPSAETWTTVGSLKEARASHTATLLPNGKVLVAAGRYDGYGPFPLDSAELYDSATGTWTSTGHLTTFRENHAAALLANGKVLVVGGDDYYTSNSVGVLASAELYDPSSGIWTATGSLATARGGHTATLLPNGKVLVVGGSNLDGLVASAELYDPQTEMWTATGSLQTARAGHTATLLGSTNGKVLVAGGSSHNGYEASAELYDPATGTWSSTDSLAVGRNSHTATLLLDGSVLIAGGRHESVSQLATASAELYVHSAPLQNISTRSDVQTDENVMIAGFIILGSEPETVVLRGIGPSLPMSGSLGDPTIELHDSSGALLASNDNWLDDPNHQHVIDSGLAPTNDLESALWQVLDPGTYTVVLQGHAGETGIGLVEAYGVSPGSDANLANISTRGWVQADDNVLIGGFIINGGNPANVLLRAVGPSLSIAGALSDPMLEVYDESGTLINSNDNWKLRSDGSSQEAEIKATTIPPSNDLESALLETLSVGSYTAIVRGKDAGAGVGLVEVYNLQ
ncbi:MAG TPA: kelch repeat-containing protein [Chthoniobacterales bacterium]|nr:kelch repeat-containing protein [Chthoniobacterales bacterium]